MKCRRNTAADKPTASLDRFSSTKGCGKRTMDHANALLLTCLKNNRPEERVANLKGFTERDWGAVLTAASRFGVTPLLFEALKSLACELIVPASIVEQLQNAYYVSATRNVHLYRQLRGIIEVFNKEGISVILLKGAHLAEFVYGNPALRPMADLDILARRDDFSRIDQILLEQGYSASKEDIGFSLLHLPVYKKENAIRIEVHSNICVLPFSTRFDIVELWERAQVETFQGFEALTLCPVDLLVHLCVHTCIDHAFDNGIMPLVDIARTVEHYHEKLDWDEVLIRSRQWGLGSCIYLMLALAKKMLGLSTPDRVLQQLRPGDHDLDLLAIAETLVFERGAIITPHMARLFGRDSWRQKLQYVRLRAFPSKESMFDSGLQATTRNPLSLFRFYWSRTFNLYREHRKTVWAALDKEEDTITALKIQNSRNQLRDWLMQTRRQD
jgi:hypothetical protein